MMIITSAAIFKTIENTRPANISKQLRLNDEGKLDMYCTSNVWIAM